MEFEWDDEAGAGYIHLLTPEERFDGVAQTTIPLDSLEEASDVEALHSLLLDFDRDGKLIGIEILSRDAIRNSTLHNARERD
jgi:uncharacterized protein YuzE